MSNEMMSSQGAAPERPSPPYSYSTVPGLVAVAALCVGLTAMPCIVRCIRAYRGADAGPQESTADLAAYGLLLLGWIPFAFLSGMFVRTAVDADGIESKPLGRRPRRLDWAAVDTVRWAPGFAVFDGAGGPVKVTWASFGVVTGRAVQAFVRQSLLPHYRLPDPRPRPPTPAESRASCYRLIGLIVVMLAAMLPAHVMLVRDPYGNRAWAWLFMSPALACFGGLLPYLVWRESRRGAITYWRAPARTGATAPPAV